MSSPAGPGSIKAPEKLSARHDLSQFQCGEPALDNWLRRRALHNEESCASRTYVLCVAHRVVGYYALAAGAIAHVPPSTILRTSARASGRATSSPDALPVMVIGRLAVDQSLYSPGLANYQLLNANCFLLRDAVLRTLQAAEIAGIRAILVHAISERAKRFYEKSGFIPSPLDPMTLMITVAEARKALVEK